MQHGIIKYGWYMKEIASLFLIMGVIVGIIAKLNYNHIAQSFTKGCNDMVVAAGIYGVQSLINYIVSSGSGQAAYNDAPYDAIS